LNQGLAGSKFLRIAIMIPWAIPTVVIGIMWKWIYDANYGAPATPVFGKNIFR